MRRTNHPEHGSAAVELVLVTPLLLVLLLAVAYAGRVMHAQTLVRHAADQGARAASLRQTPAAAAADGRAAVIADLTNSGVSCPTPQVQVDTSDFRPGGVVRVVVRCSTTSRGLGLLGLGPRAVGAASSEVVDARRGG
jgi:Flp pilus assembly protein TadG